jgi:TPR repeat protein
VKWYRLSADQGDAFAQHNLGYMYAKGDGVPQDYIQAHMW